MTTPDAARLLAAYDDQTRAQSPERDEPGITTDQDGPLLRTTGGHQGFVTYRNLAGLRGAELDALIARQVAHFRAAGQSFEWKTRGHDEPADLPERLLAAGFVPSEVESVEIGVAADQRAEPVLPAGATLRLTREPADLERICAFESEVWGQDMSFLGPWFTRTLAAEPDTLDIAVVETENENKAGNGTEKAGTVAGAEKETGGRLVSAAWSIYRPGTDFTYLAGGSTLPEWRRRGLYRALVAFRANLAVERGYTFLQVDASKNSRPILERLGFRFVTTTTPYIWTP